MFAVWIFVVLILAAQSSAALPINPPCAWFSGLIRWKAVSARRTKRQSSIAGPVYPADFPDPATISLDGQYHAFSTQSGGKHVPFASLGIDNRWVVKGTDALPMPGRWSTGTDIWAPDVVQLGDGSFVMYYAASSKTNPGAHCIGTSTSRTVDGPYEAADEAFVCSAAQGGAIDPNGYQDPSTKFRYVLYKIDGNNNGNGGDCKNSVEPIVSTPIQLQQVGSDGVSPIGEPVTILDRDNSDGPLVEAPSLFRSPEGVYFLFFSSGCYSEPSYSVKYATATAITGPYTKASAPLLKSGDGPDLKGPGGARISADGRLLVFHAITNSPSQPLNRAMFTANPTFSGTTVTL